MTDSVGTSEIFPEHKEQFRKMCTQTAGKVATKQIDIIHLKKNQLDAKFFFSIFRQTLLHVSDLSTAHRQELHRMYTTIDT